VAPTPGNHDASPFAEFAPERTEYLRQWRAAERTPPLTFIDRTHYPLRYTFVHRGAWFVSLDAAAAGPLSVEQRRWVETQLSRGADYRIKIAFGHLPVYPSARQRELEVVSDSALEALFEEHRVTAYVSGHHHAYYPGAARGIRHVSMPCLGAGARRLVGTSRRSERALVVLDVKNDELVSVEALRAPEFEAAIERSELPRSVAYRNRVLERDDLSGFSSAVVELRNRVAPALTEAQARAATR
jgi:hypothetical protein